MSEINKKMLFVIRFVFSVLVILWFMLLYYFSGQSGIESTTVSREVVEKVLITKDKISKNFLKIKNSFISDKNKDIQNAVEYDIIMHAEKTSEISKERILKWEKIIRKFAHFGLFTLGGFLIYLFFVSMENKLEYSERRLLLSIFVGITTAIFDEYHQKFSVGRSPELKDVFIDSCGMVTGCLIAVITVFVLVKLIDRIFKDKNKKSMKIIN